ncbi:hypothetical protein OOK41_31580 [Micromonospora sp. NBC_01655]|uniref:hypothetical protein n=1 Tax=Micromonospora sp. NBC_01655 TaxID=2975983 RepID=UPI00225C42ED|nr:hypothetical protein [Micromonospora sp. NBC_01655]MCX4470438.1 hypothetical protein [Micromonospora sp. NBC_01655]MCX4474803.1 hypothetical protein [Micromonospora sp. NBC_01655]
MTVRGWHVLVVVLLTAVLAAGLALVSSTRSAALSAEARRESERRWCGVVVALDDAYRESPPQTPAGLRIAASIAQLRTEFGCPG